MTQLLSIISRSSLFELPQFLSGTSAWDRHIPFAFLLVELVRPRCLVELGTHKGDSYLAFCQSVKKLGQECSCYAVDSWMGEEHAGVYGEDVYRNLLEYHQPRYAEFSHLIRDNFESAVNRFADGSVDILHIDGLHTYEAVRRDFQMWAPKLSHRAIVLFHDTQVRERDFGVWRLWEELSGKYPHFEFTHGSGLGVLAVGPDIPAQCLPLFALPVEEQTILRSICESLGHRGALYFANQSLEDRLRHAIEDLATVNEHLAGAQQQIATVNTKNSELQTSLEQEQLAAKLRAETLNTTIDSLLNRLSTIENSRVWRANRWFRHLLRLS